MADTETKEIIRTAIELIKQGVSLLESISQEEATEPNKNPKHTFEEFRKKYPGVKRGFDAEFEYFKQKNKDWAIIALELPALLDKQIKLRQQLKSLGRFVAEWKNLKTYLGNRSWEETCSTGI